MKNKYGWVTESKSHIELKKIASKFLKKKLGFKDNEISYEKTITIQGNRLRGDVIAISKDRKAWVECGDLRFGEVSVKNIKAQGFQFIHFPYPKSIKNLMGSLEGYYTFEEVTLTDAYTEKKIKALKRVWKKWVI